MAEEIPLVIDLVDKLTGPVDKMTKALADLTAALDSVNKKTDENEKKQDKAKKKNKDWLTTLHETTSSIKNIGSILGTVGGAVADVGKFFFDAAQENQRFTSSLTVLLGTQERAEGMKDALDKLRPSFFGTQDQLEKMTTRFLGMGMSIEEVGTLIPAISDIGAKFGDPAKGQAFADLMGDLSKKAKIGAKDFIKLKEFGISPTVKEGVSGFALMNDALAVLEKQSGGALGKIGADAASKDFGILAERAKEFSGAFFEDISKSKLFDKLGTQLGGFLDQVGPGTENFKKLQDAVLGGLDKITDAIFGNLGESSASVDDFVNGAVEGINFFVKAIVFVVDAIKTAIHFFQELIMFGESLGDAFFELPETLKGVGMAIIDGLINGIKGGMAALGNVVDDIKEATVGKLKNILGIRSPSKVFEEMGMFSAEGFAEGIEGGKGGVAEAVGNTLGGKAIGPSVGGLGGNRSAQVSVEINVNGAGGNAASIADEVRSRLEDMLPSALIDAFDNMATQQGVA